MKLHWETTTLNDTSKPLLDRHPAVHTHVQTPHNPFTRGGYAWQWDRAQEYLKWLATLDWRTW